MFGRLASIFFALVLLGSACAGSTDDVGTPGAGEDPSASTTPAEVDLVPQSLAPVDTTPLPTVVMPADGEVAVAFLDQEFTFAELASEIPGVALDGSDPVVGQFIGDRIVAAELEARDAATNTPEDEALIERLTANGFPFADPGSESILEQIRLAWRLAELSLPTEDELAAEIDADPFQFSSTCSSHILVEAEDEAQEIVELLAEGADFAELAIERSTGPSGPNGGDLGCNPAGTMVPEFDEALSQIAIGEVGGPVQTQFGWHVVTINDQTIDESEAQLASLRGQLNEASDAFLAYAAETPVTVHPILGTWIPDSFQLAPPAPQTVVPG